MDGSNIQRASWHRGRDARNARLEAGAKVAQGKNVEMRDATHLLEAVIRLSDLVCLEGDNQKQADVLSAALPAADPAKVRDLHMVQSGVVLRQYLFANFRCGAQSCAVCKLLKISHE
jgi:malonate decarboxylase alpha subunit